MRKTFSLPVAATAAGGGPTPPPADTVDNIEHSVRFNRADSAHLTRTISGSSNTYTVSMWVKRHAISTSGVYQYLFSTDSCGLAWQDTDTLYIFNGSVVNSTAVFRDPSAWYHVCISVDNLSADVYVNGVEVMSNVTMLALQTAISFSRYYSGAPLQHHANQSLANIHVIDGYAKLPGDFTFTDSNGVLQPKAYTGSYGTNGAHLDFADTSSATALGNDVSGNNNDFTPSGLVAGPAYTANSWSTEFDGTGDYIDNTSNYLISSTTSTFTVESWIYMTANPTNDSFNIPGLISVNSGGGNGTNNYMSFGPISSRKLRLRWYSGAENYAEGSTTLALNTWYHVACAVNSNSIKFFVNGVEETLTGTTTLTNRSGNENGFAIGQTYTYANYAGRVSNLRVIDGRALYTAAFTPPSTALTATDDTVLLTCQDATVRDNSNIGHSVTASGDVAVVNEGPFNGYSGSFDGTGDYLSIPDNAAWDLGNTFTIEAWVNFDTLNNFNTVIAQGSGDWYMSVKSDGSCQFYDFTGGEQIDSSSGVVAVNTWNHIAISVNNGTAQWYVNGSASGSSGSLNVQGGSNPLYIGIQGSSYPYDGKISNLRITKGQALYTAAFTPPTADLTTTSQGATASNVKLLTCQNSTFIDNSPSAHTITANGNASTISVNPHTDKYSVTFDGTGDYLSISASSDFNYTSTDFTWESWVRFNNVSNVQTILSDGWNISNSISGFAIRLNASKIAAVGYDAATSPFITVGDSTTLSANTWYHVAFTRNGNDHRLFINGVQEGSTVVSSTKPSYANNALLAGAWPTYLGTRDLNGYLSNVRVTIGQALYTSNFLPSKEDLTTTSQGATASNVKLLTCQSYKIQDNSDSAHTITVNGNAAPSTVAPFVTSGAGSFDGNGDYLSTPSSSDYNLGTGDFTVECLVNFNDITSNFGYVGLVNRHNYSPAAGWGLWLESGGLLSFYLDGGLTKVTDTASVSVNKWYHVAAVRNGSTVSLYVDGQLKASTTNSSFTDASTQLNIGIANAGGAWNAPYPLNGEISNLRISKGLARYTAAFTPPTEDFDPTDQDTTFLALQGNTLDDLSGNDHAVTANGDAATSTVSPFEPVDGSDAMLDSPTNYGSGDTVRGNYCTLNPIDLLGSGVTLSEGNLKFVTTASAVHRRCRGTIFVSSGKWYAEATLNTVGGTYPHFGIITNTSNNSDTFIGGDSESYGYNSNGGKSNNGSATAYGATYTTGDTIGVALDLDAGTVVFYKNGVSQGTAYSSLSGLFTFGISGFGSSATWTLNFGQQPFKYPVAGYKSLCSTNLPTPAVADGSTAMDVAIWTGDGQSTRTISGLNFSPDFAWLKNRSSAYASLLYDAVRGVGINKALTSYDDRAEGAALDNTTYGYLDSLTSDGFTLTKGSDATSYTNGNNQNYVAWTWDAGSSTVSNNAGTIISQVRANPSAGVSIATWTSASSSTTNSFGHELAKTPEFIVMKSRNNIGNNSNWLTYHSALGATKYLRLNTTDAATTTNIWVSGPSSSVVNIEAGAWQPGDWITYAFAPVEGFSAFGSYTGSTDLPFVYTGFRPRWILIKRSDLSASWHIYDTERGAYNVVTQTLAANEATAESGFTSGYDIDLLSNGFKPRSGSSNAINTSGGTYIYAAFAEHPCKTSRAR